MEACKKVLIVEDEFLVAQDLAEKIRFAGYEVTGLASSGRDAIERARTNPPDLILMDIRIQGDLNGIETAIVIQGNLEKTVPVIFLTAFVPEEFPYLKVVDPYIYLNKPFTEEQLFDCINHVLKHFLTV